MTGASHNASSSNAAASPAFAAAVLEAARGSMAGLEALRAKEPAWETARAAYAALTGLDRVAPRWPAPLPPDASPETHEAHAVGLNALTKLCVFTLSPPPRPLQQELTGSLQGGAAPWAMLALAWESIARGEPRRVALPAQTSDDPALRIETKTVQALGASAVGDIAGAVASARSAARMAHAEAIRLQEYLAYFALARARRLSGLPYAAARILSALRRGAAPIYAPLLEIERALAGDAELLTAEHAEGPATHLLAAIAAGRAGDGAAAREALGRIAALTSGTAAAEMHALHAASQCSSEADASAWSEGAAFRSGASHDVPAGIAGAAWAIADLLGATPGVVLAAPGRAAERTLALGGVGRGQLIAPDAHGERVASAAAILALAGESGLDEPEFFRSAYGFAYVHATHDGVLRVLVHRLRAAVAEHASVERGGGRIALTLHAPLLIQDPRTRPVFGDRVLRLVASRPGLGARDIAARLGSSIRSVQEHLALLVDTGACASSKDGRRVAYTVEDTTFSEPTHLRGPRP